MMPTSAMHPAPGLFSRTGIRYEVVCDVIGALVSHYAERIGQERSGARPNLQRTAQAQRFIGELKTLRDSLDPKDAAAIELTMNRLAPLARHLYGRDELDAHARQRAEQFAQANASLALEGLEVSLNDLAVQARVIRGELTHDQAVALFRGRHGH